MKNNIGFGRFGGLLAALVCLAALALPSSLFAAEAGKFQFVAGDIKVANVAGVQRVPVKGEAFNAGETIITGTTGSAQIRMSDGGLVAVRPDTQLKLDQYVFNGREDGSERKIVSLIKGGFRAITGLIGNRNKDNYRILTPSATIGIRGTDHEAVVIPAGAVGGFQAGTYDRVYRGATIIETDKGKLIVNPNQVGFTPGKGAAPVLLPKIPEFFNTRTAPDVARDTQKDKGEDGGDGKSPDTRDSVRATTTLKNNNVTTKDTDGNAPSKYTTPLDATSVRDLGTKTEALTTPLSDANIKSGVGATLTDTTSSTLKGDAFATPVTVPTTRSTEVLSAPVVSTTTTLKTPVTTTVTSPTLTTPITTISPKVTESVTVPKTTIRSNITTKP